MSGDETPGVSRTLRHKERQRYLDDEGLTPTVDESDGPGFNLEEKLSVKEIYNARLVQEIRTNEFNLKYFQEHGFHAPLLFHNKEGLGLKVPSSDFTVNYVKNLVGAKRMVDVVDVQTQKGSEMTMKDFVKYYENPNDRRQLLNVISLEFSKTKMEPLVQAPALVRQVDWVDCVWPRDLKDAHNDSTNNIKTMKYPKVQKYVLMSVAGCYTDFHIDFGGTSVWYHVLRGKKIFWLIPSTAENFDLYINWTLSGHQDKCFFGDIVAQCQRVELVAGDTFMIPTGWIHAVYTPEDSLVFGGNFLHSYNMTKQLQVAAIEDSTRVPEKFRYPLYHEMHWYVLERYVCAFTGKSFLTSGVNDCREIDGQTTTSKLLTSHELEGLEQLILFLEHTSPASKVPQKIKNSAGLLKLAKSVLAERRGDDPKLAVTGIPILGPLTASRINESAAFHPETVVSTSAATCASQGLLVSFSSNVQSQPSLTQSSNFSMVSAPKSINPATTIQTSTSSLSESGVIPRTTQTPRGIGSELSTSINTTSTPSQVMPRSCSTSLSPSVTICHLAANYQHPPTLTTSTPNSSTPVSLVTAPSGIPAAAMAVKAQVTTIGSVLSATSASVSGGVPPAPLPTGFPSSLTAVPVSVASSLQQIPPPQLAIQIGPPPPPQGLSSACGPPRISPANYPSLAPYPVTTFLQSFKPIPQLHQQQPHHHQVGAPGPVEIAPLAVLQQPPTLSPQPLSVCSGRSGPSPCSSTPMQQQQQQLMQMNRDTPPSHSMPSSSSDHYRFDESSPMDSADPGRLNPADPKSALSKRSASARRRRTRCRRCLACTRSDCGDCVYCKDMKKFGGPGRMKQSCLSRQCMAPVLPHTAVCMVCGDDERIAPDGTILTGGHGPPGCEADSKTTLMECGICWEIVHPKCLLAKLRLDAAAYSQHLAATEGGNVNSELPNSWECPRCCILGRGGSLKPRVLKQGGRGRSSSGSRASSPSGSVGAVSSVGLGVGGTNGTPLASGRGGTLQYTGSGGMLNREELHRQLHQRSLQDARSSTPSEEDSEASRDASSITDNLRAHSVFPTSSGDSGGLELIAPQENQESNVVPPSAHLLQQAENRGIDADAGDSSATEEGDGGERIMMMVADDAATASTIDGISASFVEKTEPSTPGSVKKKPKKRKACDEDSTSSNSPRKRIKVPSGSGGGTTAAGKLSTESICGKQGVSGTGDGSDNESESESEGELMGSGVGGGACASSGGNSSDSDNNDSKDSSHRLLQFSSNKAGSDDITLGNGNPTPKQVKKQLKGKLKSMTRLEKTKWLKRAKKELVKRFGGLESEEKVKSEGETDTAGRRNEDSSEDVFQLRGSKTLADLRVNVEKFLVRPWEEDPDDHEDPKVSPSRNLISSTVDDAVWFNVFRHFDRKELCVCAQVSRAWFKWANDQRLWKSCRINFRHVKGSYLVGLVRRQPESLDLSWTDLDANQLLWLLRRLPRLKSLRMVGLSQSTVGALASVATPLLRRLDVSEADSITDAVVRDVIGPPPDHRPGIFETKSRLRYLTSLSLKGCNISDVTLRFMTIHLKSVEMLDISFCTLISDDGLDALTGNEGSSFPESLQQISLVGLRRITGRALTHLSRCSSLIQIDLSECPLISEEACRLFITLHVHMPLNLAPDSRFIIQATNAFVHTSESLAS